MKRIILLIVLALAVFVIPAAAQDATTVAFGDFSFSLPTALASSVNIVQYPGDPTDLDQPGGPEVKHTEFVLYNTPPAPQSFLDGVGGIRIYATTNFAGYAQAQQEYQNLQALLAQRPDLAQYMVSSTDSNSQNLPFLPVFPAAQVIRASAAYLDTPYVQGVRYVTVYRQDVSPFVGSEFLYTFQGITVDGARYVTATFRLNTSLFPAEIPSDFDYDTFNQQFTQYLSDSIVTLNAAAPGDFSPALATLDALVQSFALSNAPQLPTTPLPPATIEATPTAIDESLGGLGGVTWILTAYGDPNNPQPALESAPVTLMFSSTGVAGNAGCNTYGGAFQFDGTSLTVSQLVTTLMACADQSVMTQETAFLGALGSATSFQLDGSQLTINYDGGVLVFTAG
ncbi:MAG: META domain-containing protein [Anaerolineae bacterium]|nr:META domain-containing protein [Anaerolineae bacterium]